MESDRYITANVGDLQKKRSPVIVDSLDYPHQSIKLHQIYSRLQVGEVQIIVRAWQCHAPTCVPHLPETRCNWVLPPIGSRSCAPTKGVPQSDAILLSGILG